MIIQKKNILVFPCGSEIGLEIHRALSWTKFITLYGATSQESNHGKFVYKNYIDNLPYINSPGFLSQFNEVLKTYNIDYVLPAHDSVVLKLSELSEQVNSTVLVAPYKTCKICRSKSLTYNFFNKIIPTPEIFDLERKIEGFPVFIKPDVGQGSKGTHIAYSQVDIDYHLSKDPSLLVLEYLPGREYTVDCFTDRFSNLLFIGARERVRIMNGISVNTTPFVDPRIDQIANIINEMLKFRGSWYFQLKVNKAGEYCLLEIAPRIAGSMAMYRNLSINFPLLNVYDAMQVKVDIAANAFHIEMDRSLYNRFKLKIEYEHIYLGFEGCLIINEKVNTQLVYLLYQALNQGKKIHLLTKCGQQVQVLLKQFRLESLFDSVILLDEESFKAQHIKELKSIFIDGSFMERKEVTRTLKIPVFDLDAIESLMDDKR